jgi:hypothetical protein
VDWPSPWQRERVARHLSGFLPDLSSRLNQVAGGHVLVGAISIEPSPPASTYGVFMPPDLAAAVVAASLGHAMLPTLDLASPAEAAVLSLALDAVRDWAGAWLPGPSPVPDVHCVIDLQCLSIRGRLEVPVLWQPLWELVRPALAAARRSPDVPVGSAVATVEALLSGLEMPAADLVNMKEGDLILMPAGSGGRLALYVGAVPLGTASLGAMGGHLAARIDEVLGSG